MAVGYAERARRQHHSRRYQGLSLEDLEERPGCARVSCRLLSRKVLFVLNNRQLWPWCLAEVRSAVHRAPTVLRQPPRAAAERIDSARKKGVGTY
jgi:hypothetical protein